MATRSFVMRSRTSCNSPHPTLQYLYPNMMTGKRIFRYYRGVPGKKRSAKVESFLKAVTSQVPTISIRSWRPDLSSCTIEPHATVCLQPFVSRGIRTETDVPVLRRSTKRTVLAIGTSCFKVVMSPFRLQAEVRCDSIIFRHALTDVVQQYLCRDIYGDGKRIFRC